MMGRAYLEDGRPVEDVRFVGRDLDSLGGVGLLLELLELLVGRNGERARPWSGEERKRGRREPAVSRARALRRDATESCSLTLKSLVREAIVVQRDRSRDDSVPIDFDLQLLPRDEMRRERE